MTDPVAAGESDDTVTQPGRAPLEMTTEPGRPPLDWGAMTDTGLVRKTNEDRWIHVGSGAFAVTDGMGGHVGGELAASSAAEAFVSMVGKGYGLDRGSAPFEGLNRLVRSTLLTAGFGGGGTTLTAIILHGNVMTVANIGDSRVLRLRGGSIDQLTTDHTLGAELSASGVLPPGSDRLRNSLTSYVGIAPDLFRVDLAAHYVRSGDSYVLCSDGVHGQVAVAKIGELLIHSTSATDAARRLVDAAEMAGGRDNATAIVVRF